MATRSPARGRHDPAVLADINGQEEILKLLREQKRVTQNLVQQNTSLLLLHAKLNKELQELRDETFNLQEFAQDLKVEIGNQTVSNQVHTKPRPRKLSTSLTVRKIVVFGDLMLLYVFRILEES